MTVWQPVDYFRSRVPFGTQELSPHSSLAMNVRRPWMGQFAAANDRLVSDSCNCVGAQHWRVESSKLTTLSCPDLFAQTFRSFIRFSHWRGPPPLDIDRSLRLIRAARPIPQVALDHVVSHSFLDQCVWRSDSLDSVRCLGDQTSSLVTRALRVSSAKLDVIQSYIFTPIAQPTFGRCCALLIAGKLAAELPTESCEHKKNKTCLPGIILPLWRKSTQ